jgi:membrane fusion protein (multidrug efflux system)
MKTMQKVTAAILVIVLGLMLSSCKKGESQTVVQKTQPVNIRIEQVKTSSLVDGIQVAGTVKAYEDVNMSPEEGGVVKEWKVKKGQLVKKGDLIVVLKDEVIKAGYEAANAQYKIAELNVEKQQGVYDQQGISELQYKNMQYGRDAAKANADLMKARWERTQMRSPIDGTVDNTMPNEGEFAPPGMPIARIVNISLIKIQAEVPELYSGTIKPGTEAMITFDALPGVTLKGRATFVGSTVSAANRTLMVEIALPNERRKIKPEMVAKVKIMRETKLNAVLVSEDIVQLVDRDRYIVYVEKNGVAEERRLKLGGRQSNKVEVLEGLTQGDHLIVVGYQKLVNGTPVVVAE